MNVPGFWQLVALGVASCAIGVGLGHAKLPQAPMDDAARVKAEEAKTQAAETAKKAREQEEKAMDRVAARYKKERSVKTATAAEPGKK